MSFSCRCLLSLLCGFLFWSLVPAPAAAQAPELRLHIPTAARFTTGLTQHRYGGKTHPRATVTLNGEAVRVYPTGAFVGLFHLLPGDNVYTFRATLAGQTATRTVTITRSRPGAPIPVGTRRFGATSLFEPSAPIRARVGETIPVSCRAGAGLTVVYRVGSARTTYPTHEVEPGRYVGEFEILAGDAFNQARVTFHFQSGDQVLNEPRALADGTITVLDDRVTPVYAVAEQNAAMYLTPESSARLGQVLPGTLVAVAGERAGRYRVVLTPDLSVWMRKGDLRAQPEGARLPAPMVSTAELMTLDGDAALTLGCPQPAPFLALPSPDGRELRLRVFGARDSLTWVRGREPNLISHAWRDTAIDGALALTLVLTEPLLGYAVRHEGGGLQVRVRVRPPRPAAGLAPLTGLTVCLDPGHGGSSVGAVGATGVTEKVVNLNLANALSRRLRALGAQVVLTRQGDTAIGLRQRLDVAEEQGAHLFLSLHANSIGEGSDPLSVRGFSVHYGHPVSSGFARDLYASMAPAMADMDLPSYGLVMNNLFVVRESAFFPSVLIEYCFLSHPEEEAMLLDAVALDTMARITAEGIVAAMEWAD